jgi:hypothetical protein
MARLYSLYTTVNSNNDSAGNDDDEFIQLISI